MKRSGYANVLKDHKSIGRRVIYIKNDQYYIRYKNQNRKVYSVDRQTVTLDKPYNMRS